VSLEIIVAQQLQALYVARDLPSIEVFDVLSPLDIGLELFREFLQTARQTTKTFLPPSVPCPLAGYKPSPPDRWAGRVRMKRNRSRALT
jgi:hypothetical protein